MEEEEYAWTFPHRESAPEAERRLRIKDAEGSFGAGPLNQE